MAENKKDSFTFSDKIKNSKPAFNPFSKRVSSKIGNNGKPKKTLFERTRRDAPFFVAAAAALLMLPFLYKYSGSVEDGEIITPGTDSVFEPDRSGFDPSLEDPSAQIAQLSVRDPLSLIKGWGDPEPAPSVGSYDRDGMDDTYTPPARSYRNESPYRQQAPAASRAAFQRQAPAPTKVGKLGSASMNLRGGGGGFGRFGGANLKTAAKASSAEAPKAGVKPVSLQPLRAAGNPSRSYFGQGSAAQARASRDAMGKSNALQALTDAMYDPLKANQAPLGGLGGGDFVGGAGAGKWDPHSEYKGITPWWWDMMKQQEMEKWKWKYFLWRKGLVEPLIKGLADFLVQFGTGAMSCLFTATDDISMGNMGRISTAMPGSPAGCKMLGEGNAVTLEQFCNPDGSFKDEPGWAKVCGEEITDKASAYEVWCKGDKDLGFDTQGDWSGAESAMNKMSYWGRVRHCFNNAYTGQAKVLFDKNIHTVKEQSDCKQIANHSFILKPHSYFSDNGYDKYYHIVIAKNVKINGKWLCEAEKIDAGFSVAGFNSGNTAQGKKDGGKGAASVKKSDAKVMHTAKDNASNDHFGVKNGQKGMSNTRLSEHKYADECVIYLAEGISFNHDNYKFLLEEAQKSVVVDETGRTLYSGFGRNDASVYSTTTVKNPKGVDWDEQQIGQFKDKLIPVAIEGYVMKKNPFDGMRQMRKALPMMYKDFIANYIEGQDGDSALCDWTKFNISAKNIVNLGDIHAVLTYDPEVYGNKPEDKIKVTVEITGEGLTPIQVDAVRTHSTEEDNGAGASVFRAPLNQTQLDALTAYFNTATAGAPKEIVAKWLAKEGDEESSDTTEYSSTTPTVEISVPTGITPINPETLVDKTKPYLLLSREVSAIPTELEGHRILNVQSGVFEVKNANAGKLLAGLSEDSKQRLNSARLDTRSSNAAATFMTQVVKDFNALEENKRKGTFMFDSYNEGIFLAEFVDAMYIAKNVLQKNEVSKAAVCTMMRGVALSSEDTQGKAAGLEMTNTFGAAAIYIGLDSAYYPNQYVKKDGNMVVDPRFSGDPYHWGNYVSCSKGGVYSSVKGQIEAAKVNGKFPLASMVNGIITPIKVEGLSCSPTTIVDDNRKKYVETYNDILFANEGKCDSLTGNMPIQDALDYVSKVAELGLNYKPKAVASSGGGSDAGGSNGRSQRGAGSRI